MTKSKLKYYLKIVNLLPVTIRYELLTITIRYELLTINKFRFIYINFIDDNIKMTHHRPFDIYRIMFYTGSIIYPIKNNIDMKLFNIILSKYKH